MKKIQFVKDGYEIVVNIRRNIQSEMTKYVEADAYYKDFDKYRILVLANTVESAVETATYELFVTAKINLTVFAHFN